MAGGMEPAGLRVLHRVHRDHGRIRGPGPVTGEPPVHLAFHPGVHDDRDSLHRIRWKLDRVRHPEEIRRQEGGEERRARQARHEGPGRNGR